MGRASEKGAFRAGAFDRSLWSDGSVVGFTLKEVRLYGDGKHLQYTPKNVR